VKFESITGYKTAPNVATANARYYEGRYLAGIAAGRLTKTNIAGLRGGLPDSRSAAGPERLHARHALGELEGAGEGDLGSTPGSIRARNATPR
jgi:hypothetical protein